MKNKIRIRPARQNDIDGVFSMMRALADHERALPYLTLTRADLRRELFRKPKRVFCAVATLNGDVVGTALWFYSYSALRGRWLLFIENLFVQPTYRGEGIGKNLLAYVADRALRARCAGMLWLARNSNRRAISFYESLAAKRHLGTCQFVLTGKPLQALASRAR
jgi:GNAT superfamily N-acetyltransferase